MNLFLHNLTYTTESFKEPGSGRGLLIPVIPDYSSPPDTEHSLFLARVPTKNLVLIMYMRDY